MCKMIQQFVLLYVFHAPPRQKFGPYRKRKKWDHFPWHGHNARGGCGLVVADPPPMMQPSWGVGVAPIGCLLTRELIIPTTSPKMVSPKMLGGSEKISAINNC